MDLNGKGGPNKTYDGSGVPSDIVSFLVLDNGDVYPLGLAADNLVDKKAEQMYHDSYSLHGTASYLSKICFDRVIDASKLRQLIRDIKN